MCTYKKRTRYRSINQKKKRDRTNISELKGNDKDIFMSVALSLNKFGPKVGIVSC